MKYNGIVRQERIRPDEHEKIRESRHRHAEQGRGAVAPELAEIGAVAADDAQGRKQVGATKPGGEDEGVERAFNTIRRDDAAIADLFDGIGDQLDIFASEGAVIIIGKKDLLAAHGVGRRQPLAQIRISDLAREVRAGEPLERPHEGRMRQGNRIASWPQYNNERAERLSPGIARSIAISQRACATSSFGSIQGGLR